MLAEQRQDIPSFSLQERSQVLDTQNAFLLPGTGFDVRGQVDMWIRELNDGFKNGLSFEEVAERLSSQAVIDMREAADELLKDRLVFHWDLIKEKGSNRFFDPRYGEYLNHCIGNEDEGRGNEERWGSTRRAINGVASNLATREITLEGMISPPGETNLPDGRGGTIKYQDLYFNFYSKRYDKVEATTIKLGFDLGDGERIVASLADAGYMNVPETTILDQTVLSKMSEQERIINLVESIPSFRAGLGIKEIMDKVRVLSGKQYAWEGTSKRKNSDGEWEEVIVRKTFDDLFWELEHRENLKKSDEVTTFHTREMERKIQELLSDKGYFDFGEEDLNALERIFGDSFIALAVALKGKDILGPGVKVDPYATFVSNSVYKDALTYLQSKPGCAGGGGAFGRSGLVYLISGSGDFEFFRALGLHPKEGTCRDCGESGVVADCDICRKCQVDYDDDGENSRRRVA